MRNTKCPRWSRINAGAPTNNVTGSQNVFGVHALPDSVIEGSLKKMELAAPTLYKVGCVELKCDYLGSLFSSKIEYKSVRNFLDTRLLVLEETIK